MSTATIARLKITLDRVTPQVMRRVEVPLDRLHLVIQAAMGWTNSHLYEIRARDASWCSPDADSDWVDDFFDARNARLGDVLEYAGAKTLRYVYDFGDGWEHTVRIERLVGPAPATLYPRLIKASGRCPPEDVGGPWGYAEFLEAMNDPGHPRHKEFAGWIDEKDFDPAAVDVERLTSEVAGLARYWASKPSA